MNEEQLAPIDPRYLRIKIWGAYDSEVVFRMKRTTRMKKLKLAYSNHADLDLDSLRFLYEGHYIADYETPDMLKMQNNDVVEVYMEQHSALY